MTQDSPDAPVVVPWYHWLWVFPVACFVRLWLATLRFDCQPDLIDEQEGPLVILLWHDRLFVASRLGNSHFKLPITTLVSASKDGAWLSAYFQVMGLKAVRGSSNRRGAAALISLARAVRAGTHAGVTPDGPKGPARFCKTGAVALAKITKRPFMILGISYQSCWTLKSWDRFALPKPFSKVRIRVEKHPVPNADEADEAVALRLQERLNVLSGY
jgi:lysophospholipid acyltransferase (LPLAT)-like uncharacterized protein